MKVAKDTADAVVKAKQILGMTLVTHQTGLEGRLVQRLLVEEAPPFARVRHWPLRPVKSTLGRLATVLQHRIERFPARWSANWRAV